jgi:hypothetical protein
MYTFVDCVIVWGSGLLLASKVPCPHPGISPYFFTRAKNSSSVSVRLWAMAKSLTCPSSARISSFDKVNPFSDCILNLCSQTADDPCSFSHGIVFPPASLFQLFLKRLFCPPFQRRTSLHLLHFPLQMGKPFCQPFTLFNPAITEALFTLFIFPSLFDYGEINSENCHFF